MSNQKTQPMTTRLVAAALVTDPDIGKILILQRGRGLTFAPGTWDIPSGKGEPQEQVTRTAARELKEETGVVVDEADLRLAHVVHGSWGPGTPGMYMAMMFHADRWTGAPHNAEPHKHDAIAWACPAELPQPFMRTSLTAIQQYLAGGAILSFDGRNWA